MRTTWLKTGFRALKKVGDYCGIRTVSTESPCEKFLKKTSEMELPQGRACVARALCGHNVNCRIQQLHKAILESMHRVKSTTNYPAAEAELILAGAGGRTTLAHRQILGAYCDPTAVLAPVQAGDVVVGPAVSAVQMEGHELLHQRRSFPNLQT